jgi:mono/diheme cytochrome c family protein
MKTVLTNLLIGLFVFAGSVLAFSMQSATDHGREVYAAQKCALCHSISGIGGKKSVLDGVGSKLNSEDIRKWIRTPKGMKPNTVMKPYSNLPEKDLDDLVAFIMTLR